MKLGDKNADRIADDKNKKERILHRQETESNKECEESKRL
jgi:hypothetical protein